MKHLACVVEADADCDKKGGKRRLELTAPEGPKDELRRASDAIPIQRHPIDCTVYFIYNIPYHCAAGTAFSMKHLACVVADEADCEKGGKAPVRRASDAIPIQRHPTDCTVYFIYNIPYHCAAGTAFSMKHLACVVADEADCKKGK